MSDVMTTPVGLDPAIAAARLRLLAWTQGDNRLAYLAVLRGFERAHRRGDRPQGLHPDDVAAELATVGEAPPADLDGALDQLTGWGVLAKAYDTGAVRSIADYRRRRSLYALTELGYLSFRLVEDLVAAAPSGSELKILALGTLHRQLLGLAEAAERRDAVGVAELLDQLHLGIADLAERAERFYRRLADLARASADDPDVFLARKDLLVHHLGDFQGELARHRPRLAAAVEAVRRSAPDAVLVDLACEADRAALLTPEQRRARWDDAWTGIRRWFVEEAGEPSVASVLEQRTIAAIAETTTLLRRLVARRGPSRGRQAQLRHLAAWLAACDTEADANALLGAALGLHRPRRLGALPADPDGVRPSAPWGQAPPVEVSATFRNQGHLTSPGRPQPVRTDPLTRQRLAIEHRRRRAVEQQALADLAGITGGRPLDRAQLDALLRLLDRALSARAIVEGRLGPGEATDAGVRIRVIPDSGARTALVADDGELVLHGARLERSRS